jgi:hypothetical protein
MFKMMNAVIPVTQINTMALTAATETLAMAETAQTLAMEQQAAAEMNTINIKSQKVLMIQQEVGAENQSLQTKQMSIAATIQGTKAQRVDNATQLKGTITKKQANLAELTHIQTKKGATFAVLAKINASQYENDANLRNAITTQLQNNSELRLMHTKKGNVFVVQKSSAVTDLDTGAKMRNATAAFAQMAAQMGANAAMMGGFMLMQKGTFAAKAFGTVLFALAGAMMAFAVAQQFALKGGNFVAAIVAGAAMMAFFGNVMNKAMQPPKMDDIAPTTMDMGGMIYDTGKRPNRDMPTVSALGGRHFPIMVEPGETIIPKTQNMLSGGAGITLNIQGDIVTNDADEFAERVAVALPEALRRQNDMGGI